MSQVVLSSDRIDSLSWFVVHFALLHWKKGITFFYQFRQKLEISQGIHSFMNPDRVGNVDPNPSGQK